MNKSTFLAQFEGESKQAVIEYAKQITELRADVILLMARKAACFYHTLETMGIARNSAVITTDRILGMDMSWMNGKTIAIVDELVFTGTTLKDSKSLIERKTQNTHVSCHVLAVNKDYWESEYITPNNDYFELEDAVCRTLSSNIVQAMSILPRPYSVDYPLFNRNSLYSSDISAISSCYGWKLFDLSTKLQVDNKVRVYTLIPEQKKLEEFERDIGFKVTENNLSKIRVFGRYVGGTGGKLKFSFRVVPFFVFSPMSESEVNKLFTKLIERCSLNEQALFAKNFVTAKSKIRLLQYYVADRFAHIWAKDVNDLLSKCNEVKLEHDDRELSFLFSPMVIGLIKNLLTCSIKLFEYQSAECLTEFYTSGSDINLAQRKAGSISEIQQRLTQPFYDMYLKKEVVLQKLIKEYGPSVAYESKNKAVKDRLKKGITVTELLDVARKYDGDYCEGTKLAFSLFLDNAIDQGIIVPITSKFENKSNNVITRAFRHGEEVKLSNKEFYLVSLYLNAIKKNTKKNTMFSTEMEKLLVLFISCGANSHFLEEIFDRTNNISSVGVKFYAFGAVSEFGSTTTQSEKFEFDTSKSFTKELVNKGIISIVEGAEGGKYVINETPREYVEHFGAKKITSSSITDAKALGQLVSIGYNSGLFKSSAENQTLLASCLYPQNSILALSADIRIFQDRWMSQFYSQFSDFGGNNLFITPSLINNLKESLGYKALDSGINKFRAIEKRWPNKVYKKLQSAYCGDDEARVAMWEKYWKSPYFNQGGKLPDFYNSLIRKSGVWLTHTKICIDMLAYIVFSNSGEVNSLLPTKVSIDQQASSMLKASKRSHELCEIWESLKCNHTDSCLRPFYKNLMFYLDGLIEEASGLLNTAKCTVGHYGKTEYIETFDCRLRIVISDVDVSNVAEQADMLKEAIYEGIRAARNPQNKEPKKFIKGKNNNSASNGRWLVQSDVNYLPEGKLEAEVVAKGNQSLEWLIYLTNKVIYKFDKKNRVRGLVYFDLPKDLKPFRVGLNSPEIICNSHDIDTSIKNELHENLFNEITFVSGAPSSNTTFRAQSYLETLWKSKQTPSVDKVISVSNLVSRDFRVRSFQVGSINLGKKMKQVDIIILTILSEEFYAAKERVSKARYVNETDLSYGNMMVEGVLVDGNGAERNVLLVKSPEAGNTDMAITLATILSDYSTKLVVLLGIAGGVTSKLNIGDVVLADEVFYYEKQKDMPSGESARMTSYRASRWTKTQISRLEVEAGMGRSKFSLKSPTGKPFEVEKGPIGSGEKVLANSKSAVVARLKLVHDKTKAVEMEAAGLSMFMEAEKSSSAPKVQHALIIRGISDKADEEKSDDDQLVASQNAMTVLTELVRVADFSSLDIVNS
ncbi:5'-methylthioadenosine/S-adenosylhomocysteine nucleosidase family protein [Pseudoalteromonas sp. NJ631]|uniref:5'-methylthioadenosine/S-adenosylhomocysteine nucleosidase family protein n=1 Tax=Pseudoalteromonas sp. NJ631 TaxID=493915 RepID=UPI000302E71A|nr:hypothetical protein [Pseudoalteromonas sp. NJ631]